MSALIGHAKAARILGDALCDEASELAKKDHGPASLILAYMAAALCRKRRKPGAGLQGGVA